MQDKYSRHGLWIDGREICEGRVLAESVNPATGQPWTLVAQATSADLDFAVSAARQAFRTGPWAKSTASERGTLLRRLADLITDNAQELAALESRDNGKPLWQTNGEMASTAQWYRYFAGAAEALEGASLELSTTRHARTIHRPLGVVAILSPFNGPFSLTSWKLAPALAAGNAVVIKPSPDTSVTPLRLAQLATEAGFPDGIVNVVCGDAGIGAALVEHADVAAIAFTGSSEVGRKIAASASLRLKRVLIEAGGKSPFLVFGDADLDAVLPSAVAGIFGGTGQSCVASSRFIVHESIYDRFVERMGARIAQLRIGDPLDPRTQIGPLSSARQLQRVNGYVDDAVTRGLHLIQTDVPAIAKESGGFYFPPTLVTGAENHMRIARDEIFGPVAVVLPFKTEEQAVALANDSDYGLAAGIWTKDFARAHRVANRMEAGTVWVNTYRAFHWSIPFGGYKQSGYGRENGLEALREFTQIQAQVFDYGPPGPDAYAP